MLQRIQTLFLLVVTLASIALFFVPIAGFLSDFFYLKFYIYDIKNLTPDSELQFGFMSILPLLLLNLGIIALSLIAIFRYKNRMGQIRLVRLNMLLNMLLLVAVFVFYPYLLLNNVAMDTEYEAGAYIPVINMLFLFLANRYILKDEKLVRSVDRLR